VTTSLSLKSTMSRVRSEHYERTVSPLNPGTGEGQAAQGWHSLLCGLPAVTRFATKACEKRTSHDPQQSLVQVSAPLFSEQLPREVVVASSRPP
jgi:hypothetical protein